MIARDGVRLGAPVTAGGRILTPVIRVRYSLAGPAGLGSVEPLGLLVKEDGQETFYSFDPTLDWDQVVVRLETDGGGTPASPVEGETECGTSSFGPSDPRRSMRAYITKIVTITRKYICIAENANFEETK